MLPAPLLPRMLVLLIVLLLGPSLSHAAPLDDTHRNDGLSSRDASLHRSAVYEATRRAASGGRQQQQQPSVFLSLTQTLQAPQGKTLTLPVCLYPDELARALEEGINTAFAGQLTQNASVDTTYTQRLSQCSYQSFITYGGSADIANTLVQAGKANSLCYVIPRYCQALNIVSAAGAAAGTAATAPQARATPRRATSRAAGGGKPHAQRRRSSGGQHVLLQSGGSTDPDLPPVLHYNCQKHYFVQQLDHFANDHEQPPGGSRGSFLDEEEQRRQHEGAEGEASPSPDADGRRRDNDGGGGDGGSSDSTSGYDYDDDRWEAWDEEEKEEQHKGKEEQHDEGSSGSSGGGHQQAAPHEKHHKQKHHKKAAQHKHQKQHTSTVKVQQAEEEEVEAVQASLQAGEQRIKAGTTLRPAPYHGVLDSSSSSAATGSKQALAGSISRSSKELPRRQPGLEQEQQQPQEQQQQPLQQPQWQQRQEQRQQQQRGGRKAWEEDDAVGEQQPQQQEQQDEADDQQPQQQQQRQAPPRRRSPQQQQQPAAAAGPDSAEQQDLQAQGLFKQTFWVCDAAWPSDRQTQRADGHVLVFLGNEGPLGIPQQPIVFENARRLNALVILVEHRFYGESLPFVEPLDGPLPTEQYRWLDMAQVIEDTVSVVTHVRKDREVPAATPNIVVGGSYGGMLAAYHRLKRPDTFASAVASSAPMQFISNAPMWEESSHNYHRLIQRSADVMSGSTACSDAIRAGLAKVLDAGISAPGRQQLARTFRLCDATALDSKEAVEGLLREVLYQWQGFAQVNNQPPLLGQMALACQVLASTLATGSSPVEALAAVPAFFFSHDGSPEWCYGFDARAANLVPGAGGWGYSSYSYQACTQGLVFSSLLPARGSAGTLNPEDLPVRERDIDENCRAIFGEGVPPVHSPGYARSYMQLLRQVGGVVFTNGDLDGWAGGSLGVLGSSSSSASTSKAGLLLQDYQSQHEEEEEAPHGEHGPPESGSGRVRGLERVAVVTYANASHCTDTHTYTWGIPEWREQRAEAMDLAAAFAAPARFAALPAEPEGGAGGLPA